ncbi:hypothetical protein HJFPF1_08391 [Paramyrothecium foliicola]|nr:hypothetical protein HJFPF1_08391 [Paramyrothecium foliicola]
MSSRATTPDCSGENSATQSDQDQDRPRYIKWDYERLKMNHDDISGAIPNRFNMALVSVDDPSVFEAEAASLSFDCKDKAEYFERLENLRIQKCEILKGKLQDLVYNVVLEDDVAGENRRHGLIELNRNPNLVLGLRLLGEVLCQSNGGQSPLGQSSLFLCASSFNKRWWIDDTYKTESSRAPSCDAEDGHAYPQKPPVPLELEHTPTISTQNSHFRPARLEERNTTAASSRRREGLLDDAEDNQCWMASDQEARSRNQEQVKGYDSSVRNHAMQEDDRDKEQRPSRHQRTPSSASSTTSSLSSTSTVCSCCDGECVAAHEDDGQTSATTSTGLVHKYADVSGSNPTRQSSVNMGTMALCSDVSSLPENGFSYRKGSSQSLQSPDITSPIRVAKLGECATTETKKRTRGRSFDNSQYRSDRKKIKTSRSQTDTPMVGRDAADDSSVAQERFSRLID